MTVTVQKIYRCKKEGNVKAFCEILLHGNVQVRGVKVVSGKNGLFVSLPQRQGQDKKWYNVVSIIDEDLFKMVQDTVLEAYNSGGNGSQEKQEPSQNKEQGKDGDYF